ncbi:type IV toxin-antitoxin system AbiEi family antitoxin domain-containing protein [Microbacterium sp. A82]|uniref:type IV toxin-antitoxin system AbiEi family antitoxin domain-containing protein n=1 Tax=Microbacterium sp. A82 TaxID=3450452 RepID=UPI003F2B48EC
MSFVLASAVLAVYGPIVRTHELRAHGVTKREISRARAAGEIIRIRQGLYAAHDTSEELLHAAWHGGTPSCLVAGRMHGLWILDEREPCAAVSSPRHVWIGHAGQRHPCFGDRCDESLIWHWDDGDAVPGDLPPVANVLLQIAVCADDETFFAALESALRKSLIPPSGMTWLSARLPSELRWMLGFARADADSGLESLIRLRLHLLGISVRTQVSIEGVGEVDFVIGDRLIVEADGKENHDDDPSATAARTSRRHKDLVRDAKAAALGYETLRFDYALIVHDWPTVAAAIIAKVQAGAHLRG